MQKKQTQEKKHSQIKKTLPKITLKMAQAPKMVQAPKMAQAKKSPAKKRVIKKKVFTKTTEDKFFELFNGERLSHFIELAHSLEEMRDEVLAHHVNKEKNDFATWIQDVFEEKDLAKEIRLKTKAQDIQIIIYKYIIKKHLH